ncbi:Aspartate aminotransferase [Levilactobacillus zymae]|uniref:Aspartate aminotransferase n=1 Tax=Levilactobacillus zymae TaxID=267363 RepID=A0A1Y6K0I5_9LACO|nr:Aspartate aminotransferase [Levilactobacillus zymae]
MVNTILKEADLFCPNSVRINFTIYLSVYLILFIMETQYSSSFGLHLEKIIPTVHGGYKM